MILVTEYTAVDKLLLGNKRMITKSLFESLVLKERTQLVELYVSYQTFLLPSPPSAAPHRVQVFRQV